MSLAQPARVFVGIPTFNRPELVRDAVRSVLAQTFASVRIVVSDNCSPGEVGDRVEAFVRAQNDPRLEFVRQPVNGGEFGQGRALLRLAEGHEYFMILHDDDVLLPEYLAAGVKSLDAQAAADLFVANAYGMTVDGVRDDALTRQHLKDQGRIGAREGVFDVLEGHLRCGFAPISGTLFRRAALLKSGFVDEDLRGNYPFEANVFLRLGETGARGWFSARELMGVRFHPAALRRQHILRDPALVSTCIQLWSRRRFTGALERRRRVLLSRYRRAFAIIKLEAGDFAHARRELTAALRDNPTSLKAWALAPALLAAPAALRRLRQLGDTR